MLPTKVTSLVFNTATTLCIWTQLTFGHSLIHHLLIEIYVEVSCLVKKVLMK